MRTITPGVCLFLMAVLTNSPTRADSSVLVPPQTARTFGLERAWFTQIELDRSRSRIIHVTQHISSKMSRTIFEVTYKGGRLRYSERDLTKYGEMIGKERAEKWANEKVEALTKAGLEPKLEKLVVPEITLFVMTDHGTLHAIDGEDGRTRWVESFGNPSHLSEAPAANDDIVAVINGVTLFVLKYDDGQILWQRKVIGVPGAGPAASNRYVYVPMIGGEIEFYDVERPERTPAIYKSTGRALFPPTVTAESVAWQTDKGQLYVGSNMHTSPSFRIETGNAIIAAPVPLPGNLLLMASVDGYLTCLHEIFQSIVWRFSTGESISTSPVVVGDGVFVLTDEGNLFRISTKDGQEIWQTPRVSQFLSASKDRLYCIGRSGRIEIIDANRGNRVGTIPTITADLNMVNTQTDRLFFGSRSGILQCLRETALEQPILHIELQKVDKAPKKRTKPPGPPKPATPSESDAADPFGASSAKEPMPATPKPADTDPFGAAAGNEADPFQ